MNFGSEMVWAKDVSGKNIFCSMNEEIIGIERIFEIVHCPFEGQAKLLHGQFTISKILLLLPLYIFIEQNMFFQRHVLPMPFLSQDSRFWFTTWILFLILALIPRNIPRLRIWEATTAGLAECMHVSSHVIYIMKFVKEMQREWVTKN